MDIESAISESLRKAKLKNKFSPQDFFDEVEPAFAENGFRVKKSAENILVIRLDAIGDMILTSGFLRELRQNKPNAHIVLIASPVAISLNEFCPYIDELLLFNGSVIHEDLEKFIDYATNFSKQFLWPKKYDLALMPQWSADKNASFLLSYLSGAAERVCFTDNFTAGYGIADPDCDTSLERRLMTRVLEIPPEIIHEALRHIWMLEAIGMTVSDYSSEMWLSSGDIAAAKDLLSALPPDSLAVALCIGGKNENRKYPYYKEAIEKISAAHPDARFVIIGGESERRAGDALTKALPEGLALNLAGKTTVRESAAIISLSSVYLGNDTGFMHAADALGKPLIVPLRDSVERENTYPGIYSAYTRFAPRQTLSVILRPDHPAGACRDVICYGGCNENYPHCIAQITPGEVAEAFEVILNETGKV